MFKIFKRKEIDEIELGAELYLKHLKESRQAYAAKSIMIDFSKGRWSPIQEEKDCALAGAEKSTSELDS